MSNMSNFPWFWLAIGVMLIAGVAGFFWYRRQKEEPTAETVLVPKTNAGGNVDFAALVLAALASAVATFAFYRIPNVSDFIKKSDADSYYAATEHTHNYFPNPDTATVITTENLGKYATVIAQAMIAEQERVAASQAMATAIEALGKISLPQVPNVTIEAEGSTLYNWANIEAGTIESLWQLKPVRRSQINAVIAAIGAPNVTRILKSINAVVPGNTLSSNAAKVVAYYRAVQPYSSYTGRKGTAFANTVMDSLSKAGNVTLGMPYQTLVNLSEVKTYASIATALCSEDEITAAMTDVKGDVDDDLTPIANWTKGKPTTPPPPADKTTRKNVRKVDPDLN